MKRAPFSETMAAGKFPPGHSRFQSLLASFTFLKDPIQAITKNMYRFNGTYSGYLFGNGRFVITEDPEFIQYVLRENHVNYQKSELSTKTAARLFGNGLLFSNGEPWRKQRKLIQPAFHHGRMQALNETVAKTIREFFVDFPTGEAIEVYPLMRKLSFSILIHSIFDITLSSATITELSEGFTDLQDFLLKDINEPLRKFLYPVNRANQIILQKSRNIRAILQRIIKHRKSSSESHHDLLDMLLVSTYEDTGTFMEEEQVIDEILVLLFAGHETTANTLSWIMYLIAKHSDVAEKLKCSIDSMNIYESPGDVYINAVISEGMRLYPAAWMTERVALTDDQFKDFRIPRGTIIIPFFYGLHRNKDLWSHPSEFQPERFILPDSSGAKKNKYFFPFGTGPRMCIGNHFAMMEMAYILHTFLSNFEISPVTEDPAMWALITLRPRKLFLNITQSASSSAELASVN
jgi:cytochrome P450